MAITVSLLGTPTFNTTSGTKTVTATPAVGDLIIIITANSGSTTTTAAPTDNNAGGGGTYTLINTAVKATSADTMQVWVRNNLITSATSTVFTQAPGTTTGGGLVVIDCQGGDKAGSSAVVKSAIQSNQAAGGTPAPVFASAVSSINAVIGAVFNASNPATITPRTNFTELYDSGYNTPATGLEVMSRNSGETGTTMTWGSTSATAYASLVIEVDARVTHATTGTLTGQIGSIVGSAAHVAKHDTTGTLAGQLSSITGSARRYRQFSASGALTGQLGTISGTARHNIPHATSGVLTGDLGNISGSATRYRAFSTSGTLTGQGSTVTGDADREPKALPHTTTGVLTGQGSTVSGSADKEPQALPHTAIGSLVGQQSIVTGKAEVISGIEGGFARRQRKSRLIIVEVDGKEYRITEAQLPSFLEQVRVEAEQQAKTQEKPVKRSRKGKKAKVEATPVVETPVIVVKQAPPDIVPKINAQIEQVNNVIANVFAISMQKYLQELEDEEIILMLM